MTHPNHQTNGASLEDCHTNFFALTELCGIKWRKLRWGGAGSGGPLEDPVLSSYARCLAADLLCVWRRVAHSPPPPAPAPPEDAALHHHPPPPPPPPPLLSLDSAKELWIFWYGEEPNLERLVSKELMDSGGGDHGSWELGLSYECRSLLFKALHNLIERCLLSRDFVRLGKWFVQPYDGDDDDMANSCSNLSFSFAFFVHGESTVCASMDVRLHPPVKKLSLTKPPPPYTKVIMAPFGLSGNLVSVSGNNDVVESWRTFYPLEGSSTVEVAVGGVRMHYPAPYVLLTQMDCHLSNTPPVTKGCPPLPSLLAHRTSCHLGLGQPELASPLESEVDVKPAKEWEFVDPQRRTSCLCSKCWKGGGKRSVRRGPPFHRRHNTPPCLSVSGSQGTPGGSGGGEGSPGSCGGGSPGGVASPAPLAAVSTPSGAAPAQPASAMPSTPQAQPTPSMGLPHTPALTPPSHAPHTPHTPNSPKPNGCEVPAEFLKRPVLSLQETELDPLEEERPLDRLYDYSNIHAWLNHPVKKLKTDEGGEWVCFQEMGGLEGWREDLYAGHTHTKMAPLESHAAHPYLTTDIKREANQDESNKENKNLYTSDGLQASYKDLDQIFDNSDDTSGDETLQVHTPPDSNKSASGCVVGEEPSNGKGLAEGIRVGGRVPPLVRPEELCKMFPTPPSQEPSLQASPSAFTLPEPDPTSLTNNGCITRCGSPPDEHIEDWSYVFKPPLICKYFGSSKYAALTCLSGGVEPSHCVYVPSWQHPGQNPNSSNAISSSNQSNNNSSANSNSSNSNNPGSNSNALDRQGRSMGLHQAPKTPRTPHHNLHSVGSISQPASVGCASGVGSAAPPLAVQSPVASPGADGSEPHQTLPQEECALFLNLLLADTAINIFRDHNFDSCTMCVCNAGPVVGNIRGADSGVYLWGASPMSPDSPSPSPLPPSHAPEEEPIACRCGFSAVVNRRLAYKAGLFYEDEMEITGVADDPVENKREGGLQSEVDRGVASALVELVREQCCIFNSNSASALQQCAVENWNHTNTINTNSSYNSYSGVSRVHELEYTDCSDAAALAMEAVAGRSGASLHKWPFLQAPAPGAGRHVVRLMRALQPLLQEAIQKKCSMRMWDAVTGPLTWRQFHRLAGRGTEDLCEPQPVPALLVGHDRDWVALSPYALNYWDKLLLEPYSYSRDAAYVVLVPDTPTVVTKVKSFFRDLSAAYEQCRLGRHAPLARLARDGLLRVPRTPRPESLDDWFNSLPENPTSEILKLYAQMCSGVLGPLLSSVQLDHTLLDGEGSGVNRRTSPPTSSSMSSNTSVLPDKQTPSPMPPPDHPPTPTNTNDHEGDSSCGVSGASGQASAGEGVSGEGGGGEEEPCIVVYLVEPGTGADKRLMCVAMLRAAHLLLSSLPDHIRPNVTVQFISWESVCDAERFNNNIINSTKMGVLSRRSAMLRSLALSVFSQCRRQLQHTSNIKSLTGFGTAANADLFLKSKDEKNRLPYRLYVPPYILAPPRPLKDIAETFGHTAPEACSVLYLSYCLSADQSWLLGVCTDGRGELLESVSINIDVPGRARRRRTPPARRLGLTKLMDFTLGVMSQSVQPWRLVVGRIGRIGHGELKGWSWLLSKKNLLKASQSLREVCSSCSILYPANTPCILSACLVSTEPDSSLRLLADQFTPDERFSQASIASHLSTPQDVSCTHILVFPTSATTTSSQREFQEQHINDPDLGDDELLDVFDDEDMPEGIDGMDGDLWNWTGAITSPGGSPGEGQDIMRDGVGGSASRPGSHDRGNNMQGPHGSPMDDSNNRCMVGGSWEEVGTLLQQPLALGYLVSTAPLGRMPGWWWAACPHASSHCPAFLKTALHLHSPSVQAAEDLLNPSTHTQGGPPPHPLDSTYTTDVLRYVLEGYNALSWLSLDCTTQDRASCLPAHVQVLMQLYHYTAAVN